MPRYILCLIACALLVNIAGAQPHIARTQGPASTKNPAPQKKLAVIGYYAGRNTAVDSFETNKLTHIIFSFGHLKGNRLNINNASDTLTIRRLVALKTKNPDLKVILSLGGWGGCKTCPDVFSTDSGRREFVNSVRELTSYFHTDGIDLDWEYPALVNVPGYPFGPEDKDHFTELIRLLRSQLGKGKEISFAAGGYTDYLKTSIDWKNVAPLVDYINLMTYDLVSGYSTRTGHQTPLYSTPEQVESTDHAVHYLDSIGVPLSKVAIGMAFYARIFRNADSVNNGLYRPCQFFKGASYRDQATLFSPDSGWVYHWDATAQAPYMYNARQQLFASFDDTASVRLKTLYAHNKGLGGVMFWQLTEDKFTGGLLDVIDRTKKTFR
jgi:chitinase